MQKKRRVFIKNLFRAGGVVTIAQFAKAAPVCKEKTPRQPKGPFYPVKDQIDNDADLTHLQGSSQLAQGRIVHIRGVVQDVQCDPIADVYVEIWQACASGKYDHPGDPNPAPLDPAFQYWGIDQSFGCI